MDKTFELIGNTPVIQIKGTSIYVKLEKFNATGSVKDRAVLQMLQDSIRKGKINKGDVLVEATSGNTGISLAMIGVQLGFKVIIIMPETMSIERRALIKAYGGELLLTPGNLGMKGAVSEMESLLKTHENYKCLGQFDNESNTIVHYNTTGKEIIQQVPNVDFFVVGIGTGGTFSGVSKRLKEYNSNIKCYAVEPKNSAVISGKQPSAHKIQGIGAGFIPKILNQTLMDEVILISDKEAIDETLNFVKNTGILVGISSGANIAAARKIALNHPNSTIVTIAPDGGEKYLSILQIN